MTRPLALRDGLVHGWLDSVRSGSLWLLRWPRGVGSGAEGINAPAAALMSRGIWPVLVTLVRARKRAIIRLWRSLQLGKVIQQDAKSESLESLAAICRQNDSDRIVTSLFLLSDFVFRGLRSRLCMAFFTVTLSFCDDDLI